MRPLTQHVTGTIRSAAVVALLAFAILGVTPATAAYATTRPRIAAPLPASVFVSSRVHIAGRLTPATGGGRAALQEHTSRGWVGIGSAGISPHGAVSLTWVSPHRPTQIRLRVVVTKRGRTVASTATTIVHVSPQPLVVSPSEVVAVPPPGQPGAVVLHARLAGGRTAAAASDCPTLNPIPQVGQVLAVGYSANTPYGSLTKIQSVDVLGPCKVTFKTSEATLEEAVGTNGGTLDLSRFSEVGAGSASDARAHAAVSASPFHTGLGRAVSCASGAAASLSGSVSVSLTPSLHADFSLFGGLTSAEFTLTGTASASLDATVQASTACTLSRTPLLATPLHIATYAGAIGPIPVVITVQGQLYADANLEGGADGTADVTANVSITGGVSYRNGGFLPVFSGPATSFTYNPLTVSANSNDSADVEPALQVLLYGVAGPQLGVSSGLAFNANTASTPWWTLTAPVRVNAAFVSPTLDLSSKRITLYSHSFNVAAATGGFGSGAGGGRTTNTPPANISLPTITDEQSNNPPEVGDSLKASTGAWTGSPTQYAYQWEACKAGRCTAVSPASPAASYTVTESDVGETIRVTVTATNSAGSSQPTPSLETGVVGGAPGGTCADAAVANEGETAVLPEPEAKYGWGLWSKNSEYRVRQSPGGLVVVDGCSGEAFPALLVPAVGSGKGGGVRIADNGTTAYLSELDISGESSQVDVAVAGEAKPREIKISGANSFILPENIAISDDGSTVIFLAGAEDVTLYSYNVGSRILSAVAHWTTKEAAGTLVPVGVGALSPTGTVAYLEYCSLAENGQPTVAACDEYGVPGNDKVAGYADLAAPRAPTVLHVPGESAESEGTLVSAASDNGSTIILERLEGPRYVPYVYHPAAQTITAVPDVDGGSCFVPGRDGEPYGAGALSAEGNYLACEGFETGDGYVIDLEDDNVNLVSSHVEDWRPVWLAPEGSRLIFEKRNESSMVYEYWLYEWRA